MNISRREWMLATACWAELLRAQPKRFTLLDPTSAAEIKAITGEI